MMCGMCESHINDTVRQHFAVQKVTSSHTKGRDGHSSGAGTGRSGTPEGYSRHGLRAEEHHSRDRMRKKSGFFWVVWQKVMEVAPVLRLAGRCLV